MMKLGTQTMKVTPLQFHIMIQLLESQKYGYEILKNIKNDFKDSWNPQTGTIYPALNGMVKKEFIEKKKIGNKHFYILTTKSEGYLNEIEKYISEFMFISNQFIESIINRIPPKYANKLFNNILESGNMDIIPEYALINKLSKISKPEKRRELLLLRKEILLNKLSLVEEKLSKNDEI